MLIGCIYKQPEFLIEVGQYIKSKYDFYDPVTRFLYDNAMIMYETRSQTFNKTTIAAFMAEDPDRLQQFKKYGGYRTIEEYMKLGLEDNFNNYYECLKKYSLLREYQRNGYNIQRIVDHAKFELFTALDIYRLIRSKVDRIHTVILTHSEAEILNAGIIETINSCMERPDMGLSLPYPILNDLFRGLKLKSMMAVGMLSNAGKSRFMFKLIAYVTLVLKQKVFVLLNEMTVEEMRYALITTVLNNKEFKELHGITTRKNEREITLGLYKDDHGKYIYREQDDWGDFEESVEEYIQRVSKNSIEYRKLMKVAKWIEDETHGLIFAKDVNGAYDDKTLEFEIRKASIVHGIQYVFYDTLKQETDFVSDWGALKATTTKLTEFAKQLNMFIYASIQLTDDANHMRPEDLTSSQIANAKQLKHVLHTLMLFKEIERKDYNKYRFYAKNQDWGEPSEHELEVNKRYYIGVIDKNRFGSKKKLLFEVNLDTNEWYEMGEVFRK